MNNKTFYVCSFGGSGSKMLCEALNRYGETEHIHSRNPPELLEYTGKKNGGNCYNSEWFNSIKIPQHDIHKYNVIFIYRNPIKAIYSRFKKSDGQHLKNVQCNLNINFEDVIKQQKDLYGIEEFFDNYTNPNKKRNYKIICVKYEEIFEKQHELSSYLQIGPLNLEKKETEYDINDEEDKILQSIYSNCIQKMNNLPFIFENRFYTF